MFCTLTHFVLAFVGTQLAVGPADVPWLWPAAGFLPTVLAVSRPRNWPAMLIGAALAELAVALLNSGTVSLVDGLVVFANLAEALAGAAAVAALLPAPWNRRTSLEVFACVCVAALFVPLIGAGAQGLVALNDGASGSSALTVVSAWWASDLLGILLVNPVVGGALLYRGMPNSIRLPDVAWIAMVFVVWFLAASRLTIHYGTGLVPLDALLFLAALSCLGLAVAAMTAPPLLVACYTLLVSLALNLSTTVPGTLMAQTFAAPEGPHLAVRVLLLAGAVCSYVVSLVRFERQFANELADWRHAPHRVVAELATRLANCRPAEVDEKVERSLEKVGRLSGADRCVIWQIDRSGRTISQTHRWRRRGVKDVQSQLQQLPLEQVGFIVERAGTSGTVFFRAREAEAGSAVAEYFRLGQAWAVAFAPLFRDDGVSGMVSLTWQQPTRRWGTDTSVVLQSAAQVIGRALASARTARADEAYRNKLRALTARLDEVDAQVRRETAADLHDGAAQSLAVARLRLAQIRQSASVEADALQSVEEMIVTALSEIRGVIRRMVPSALYDLGLEHALRAFVVESRQQLDMDLRFDTTSAVEPLPNDAASLLYRAARELVTNAIKHAEASEINVSLARSDDVVTMTVHDDGRGFRARRTGQRFADGTGLGLFSLRERLSRIGGRIELDSGPDGTRIDVIVPLGAPTDASASAPVNS